MKFIIPMVLATLSISSFADTITCDIETYIADKGGYLMISEEKSKLTTTISGLEDESSEGCGKLIKGDLKIELCARESEYVNNYIVQVIVNEKGFNEIPTLSMVNYGISRRNGELAEIDKENSVLNSLFERLSAAEISSPVSFSYDSLQIDDAINAGFKKGLLKPNEIVNITATDCKLNK